MDAKKSLSIVFAILFFYFGLYDRCASADKADQALEQILAVAQTQRGFVVVLSCDDDALLSRLGTVPGTLVQCLHRDGIERGELHEGASVLTSFWNGEQLPYIDNLVNLIVVQRADEVSEQELLRVLVPGGVAFVRQDDGWHSLVKPRRNGTDQWTHFLHGPDNNPVANDTEVDFPAGLQWIESPLWTRDHDSTPSVFGLVSANGRLFYILDEGPIGVIDKRVPASHSLIARDAQNGVLLWKCPLPSWYPSHVQWGTTPVYLHRRLVAIDDCVYVTNGLSGPVIALDATTGEQRRTYTGSEDAAEILVDRGLLVVGVMKTEAASGDEYPERRDQAFRGARLRRYSNRGTELLVYDTKTGRRLWSAPCAFIPSMICSDGARLFYVTDESLVCVDLRSGDLLWESAGSATKLLIHDGILVTAKEAGGNRWTPGIAVQARSGKTGALLWQSNGKTLPTFANCFYIPPEIFVAKGLVWLQSAKSNAIVGLDLRTGDQVRSISQEGSFTPGHHVRCYPAKATERFAMFNKRGIEFMDFRGHSGTTKHDWVRGACRLGILPCNGMIYVPPNGCNCCVETYVRGFLALNSNQTPAPIDDDVRLHHGPAHRNHTSRLSEGLRDASVDSPESDDWPTFRHDSARTSSTTSRICTPLQQVWRRKFAEGVTSCTASAGRLLVSPTDSQTVHALDLQTGASLWSFRASGPVDSPPTLVGDLAVFGAGDGYIYCLRAVDGELVWRFQAAPADRRLVAFGQVESVWPCHGSVLVEEGIAYVTAGRSSYLDGGINLYGLNVATGEVVCRKAIHTQQVQETTLRDTFNNRGALTDILVSDGEHLFMRHLKFDDQLNLLSPLYPLNQENRANGPRVMATSGFLDNSSNKRVYRTASEAWTGRYSQLRTQQLVVGDGVTYGCRIHFDKGWKSPRYHLGDGTLVFAQDHAELAAVSREHTDEAAVRGNSGRWNFDIPHTSFRWQRHVPIYVQAAVLAGDKLLVAGRPDTSVDDAFGSARPAGEIHVLSASTGELLHQQQLPHSPILDGMIVADGNLVISTIANEIICLQGAAP